MKNSIFPSDESLPTWLHTLLLILFIAPFSGFLFWFGAGAIITIDGARLVDRSNKVFTNNFSFNHFVFTTHHSSVFRGLVRERTI